MGKIDTALWLIKSDKKRFKYSVALNLSKCGLSKIIPDRAYLELQFWLFMDRRLDLNNPKSFNEKLQWLKLNNRRAEYHRMVDKYEVKNYVSTIIGEEYIIPTLGVFESFDKIDFTRLPDQFVLKCTHDSGSVVICRNKELFNIEEARKKLNAGLNNDMFWFGREWPYKRIKRKIIVEEYLEDSSTHELRDYKFFCFNGKAICYKIDFDRFVSHHANYYDMDNNLLRFGEVICPPDFDKELLIPAKIKQMQAFAEDLANGEPFLRVDFYEVNGKIYFGELTFFPASGFGAFYPEEWDEKLGDYLQLSSRS